MEHDGESVYMMQDSDGEEDQRKQARGDDEDNSEMGIRSPDTSMGVQTQLKSKLDFNAVDSAYESRREEDGTTREARDGGSCLQLQIGAHRSSS